MKVYAKRLNDKKGSKLPVTTVSQPKASTGVLNQNNKKLITNVHTYNKCQSMIIAS